MADTKTEHEKKIKTEQPRAKEIPEIEAPKSADPEYRDPGAEEEEPLKAIVPDDDEMEWDDYKDKVEIRYFDANDVINIRSGILKASSDLQSATVDMGQMQKLIIVLGVKSCPWFSDDIDEAVGVTQAIFNRRTGPEFRAIPIEFIDKLFRMASEKNHKATQQITGLKKKSSSSSKAGTRTKK